MTDADQTLKRMEADRHERLIVAAQDAIPPMFTIDAEDAFVVPMLRHYQRLLAEVEQLPQAGRVEMVIREIKAWQLVHPDKVHLPIDKYTPQLEVQQ
jgi:hypothetical protein